MGNRKRKMEREEGREIERSSEGWKDGKRTCPEVK